MQKAGCRGCVVLSVGRGQSEPDSRLLNDDGRPFPFLDTAECLFTKKLSPFASRGDKACCRPATYQ